MSMKKLPVLSMALLCMILLQTSAFASDTSDYFHKLIISLSFAKKLEQVKAAQEKFKNAQDSDQKLQACSNMMMEIRFGIKNLEKAKSVLQDSLGSENPMIGSNAQDLIAAYSSLQESLEREFKMFQEVYSGKYKEHPETFDISQWMTQQSQLAVDIDDSWDKILASCGQVTYALWVEYPLRDTKPENLVLTSQERDALIRHIDGAFPEAKAGLRNGQAKIIGAAARIREALNKLPPRAPSATKDR